VRYPDVVTIHPKHATFPLHVRPCDSDMDVLSQVFIQQHYSAVMLRSPAGLIIDCGANVGISAAYFLTRFPEVTVIAVEPDPGNFALLQRNLAPYGVRARVIQAAVWPVNTKLKIRDHKYDDGRSWARQVEEVAGDEGKVIRGVSIDSLLAESGFPSIALLKMDIEGAEIPILKSISKAWLKRTECLAIELHDDTYFGKATPVFDEAVVDVASQIHRCGEITIAYISPPPVP
jgi:FkbM family methyltransferase